MTAGELAEAARQLVERTTTAQGLPLVVEDCGALRRVAVVLASTRETTPATNRGRLNARSGRSRNRQVVVADA